MTNLLPERLRRERQLYLSDRLPSVAGMDPYVPPGFSVKRSETWDGPWEVRRMLVYYHGEKVCEVWFTYHKYQAHLRIPTESGLVVEDIPWYPRGSLLGIEEFYTAYLKPASNEAQKEDVDRFWGYVLDALKRHVDLDRVRTKVRRQDERLLAQLGGGGGAGGRNAAPASRRRAGVGRGRR